MGTLSDTTTSELKPMTSSVMCPPTHICYMLRLQTHASMVVGMGGQSLVQMPVKCNTHQAPSYPTCFPVNSDRIAWSFLSLKQTWCAPSRHCTAAMIPEKHPVSHAAQILCWQSTSHTLADEVDPCFVLMPTSPHCMCKGDAMQQTDVSTYCIPTPGQYGQGGCKSGEIAADGGRWPGEATDHA